MEEEHQTWKFRDGEGGRGRGHRRGRPGNRGAGRNPRHQSLSGRNTNNNRLYRMGSEQTLDPNHPTLFDRFTPNVGGHRVGPPPQRPNTNTNNDNQHRRQNNSSRPNDRTNDQGFRSRKPQTMGFLMLQNLAKSDSKEIISQINDKKEAFMHLLQSPIERTDIFALILELLAKICQSSFDQIKLTILLDVCNSPFISSLRNYMMDLPYVERKSANNMYWKSPNEFWENFLKFCDCLTTLSPSTAFTKCRSLIEGTSKVCLETLAERHSYQLPDNCNLILIKLREAMTEHEKEKTVIASQRKNPRLEDEAQEPPENFRELSVIPRRGDLIDERAYLRANVVKGGYRDVEHYLDVQFRLFREDCFGPLREGIRQFIHDPTKRKYDHIRVFRNVKFVEPYVSSQKVGSLVEFDASTKKRFKKMNWAHNKRFIFGSLVLFTKDNCKTLIVATILDRDLKYLDKGMIPVSMVDAENGDDLYKNETYTMIESEVYFEPYYHVLKAMQDPAFPRHIAMQKYIVEVNPEPQHPAYVNEERSYIVETELNLNAKFKVLDFNTWPSSDELNFNDSQYEAYKMALTHEFAVIQGPPGTGKTYLGVKIAKTLIQNLKATGNLLLLVCYTNHALDQFLEAILPITDSIVRIGSQSRNEAMEKINLNNIRKCEQRTQSSSRRLFFEKRQDLKESILKLKRAQEQIESLNTSVLSYKYIKNFVPESIILGEFYKGDKGNFQDPLSCWLFETVVYDFNEPIHLEDAENEIPKFASVDDTNDGRNYVSLDDLELENIGGTNINFETSFSMNKAQTQMKYLMSCYRNPKNRDEEYNVYREIIVLRSLMRMFKEMRRYYNEGVEVSNQANMHNPTTVMPVDRWMMYFKWTNYVANDLREKLPPLQDSLKTVSAVYEESRMIMDYELLKNTQVIGMTTSGAARLRKLIMALGAPIVIVEEAAEVLEQHIVTSLTKKCQHLILIGDHQQLRPSASYMKLAKHYNIEVSLFERMIVNDMHSRRLAVQHRMRPQISALIAPAIYSDLQNHPSVHDFPNVRGITNNVFFMSHNYKEEVVDDSASKTNEQEGDLVLGLANYLMQQDYKPEDITILAAYSGQMFYMRKQRSKYVWLSKVKITVVDNYQGEESKIILLSLVRNNDDNKIGFLGTENRICVALSRAKEGFYMFGNIDILKNNSPLWTKIAATLEGFGSLGTGIRLMCENHNNQISIISSPLDYSKVPEGGCLLKCNYNLPCLHACPLMCHGYDRAHNETKCQLKCERVLCELNHVCPLKCMEECGPCKIKVLKTLPCGHQMSVYCHLEPNDPKVLCLTVVAAKLPSCGHEVKKSCYMAVEKVSCPVPCEYRVDKCGHVCTRKCHVNDDADHERYLCQKPCAKTKKGCTTVLEGEAGDHQCVKKCHEECDDCNVEVEKKRSACKHRERVACSKSPDEKPCRKKCARVLPCGHFCKKLCFEPCGTDCKQMMKKKIPGCEHEVSLECGLEPAHVYCRKKCERALPCGHPCLARCGELCDAGTCKQLLTMQFQSPCGHRVQLPCSVYAAAKGTGIKEELLLQYCAEPCGAELACSHACAGSCARCRQGRLHEPCAQPCHQINICGHQCAEPCNQVCPPCRKPCEVKCGHSKCRRDCGAPCVPCQEQCSRKCPHGDCKRRCGEPCVRAECVRPCARALRCGHPCRGLCGERCPDVCKQCRPDDFPTDFLGDEYDDDALFILLEDCGHVMEFENMENLMKGDSELIAIRSCPYCRKPIINTPRYKDIVNHMLKTEINPIKERVYGNLERIIERRRELQEVVAKFHTTHNRIYTDTGFSHWKTAFEQMLLVVKSKKKCSLLQLDMYFIYLNILELLADVHKKYRELGLVQLQDSLVEQNKMICRVLLKNVHKISQQQQEDIGKELKRMNTILILSKILNHPSYRANESSPAVKVAANTAKAVILKWGIYEHEKSREALNELQKAIKVSGVISEQEKQLIIRAIGAKAGSWYKCPNGHVYSIGQCGGAMEVGRCVECKAQIGGSNHRLLSTNQHAGDFDNSRYAAYSEEANNMANFDF
ncbi:NFX1-type zinc finger-containing protein 1 [Bicyclus anynana]|uniref:NFX1-type zinc finger-containing protein 1 n=1 Tax=Bicyclus anynana TaxID=110368 RepID=A0A6J1MHR6_BICAN|nr:NFX1-type zinc finger-containing protein 1 [Bicyclus anynana]